MINRLPEVSSDEYMFAITYRLLIRDVMDEIRFEGWIAIGFYRQVMSCFKYAASEIPTSFLLIFQ